MVTDARHGDSASTEDEGGPRRFLIEDRRRESDVITSFVLRPADGSPPMPHKAGQHLTLFAEVPGRGRQKRNFTISSAPGGGTYRISVKREPEGSVSRWLHDEAAPGAPVDIAAPSGDFVLPDDARPVVMVSGGVGLTPMVAMLEEAVRRGHGGPIDFIHCSHDGATHAFGEHVRQLAAAHGDVRITVFYTRPRPVDVIGRDFDVAGHLTPDWLAAHTPVAEADYFVCGPAGFLRTFVPGLAERGVAPERLHYEFFGPVEDLFAEAAPPVPPAVPPSPAVAPHHARAAAGFSREQIGGGLLDSPADAVVASDAEGAIVLWNAGAQRIFGFTEDEALGQSLDIIIPEPFRARHWDGYRETVASGVSRYGAGDMLAVPGLRKDGRRISLEFTIALLKDDGGKVTGMVAVLRDVTARFEEMKALKKQLADSRAG